jgi:GNAT superfamily N-acetyltransferase
MSAETRAHAVRLARAEDLPQLAAVELAAASRFRTQGVDGALLAQTVPAGELRRGLDEARLWVATAGDDRPVGFALASVLEGGPHLEELDVHPDHGRRGLGAALVAAVLAWARAAGHAGVTLVTFRDVPWNAPFYERLGFRPLAPDALGPALRERLAEEARRGLPVARRVVMRAALDAPGRQYTTRSASSMASPSKT